MASISKFRDFRRYLSAIYEENKIRNPKFSYQLFANKVGISNKGFLYNLLQGKKKLGAKDRVGVINGLKLNKKEAMYFENLVLYNQADTEKEKEYFLHRLKGIKFTGKNKATVVHSDQYDFYSRVYHTAIRSLVNTYKVKYDYRWLAQKVFPPIKPSEARESVQLLIKLGLIKRNKDGVLRMTSRQVKTPEDIRSMAIRKFHEQSGEMAINAIRKVSMDKRNVSGMTLGISEDTYNRIVEDINQFRAHVQRGITKQDRVDRVYRMNIQFFPLSKVD